jgi:hypothetical protein
MNKQAQEWTRIRNENQQIAEIDGALCHANSSARATMREPRKSRAVSDAAIRVRRARFEI